MEIVNKEQEREEQSRTPEAKRKKLIKNVVIGILAVIILAYAYLSSHHPMFIGSSHPVTVAGFTVKPGQTTVQDLTDGGFFLANMTSRDVTIKDGEITSGYSEAISPYVETEPYTYYTLLELVKNGQSYARVSVVNESSQKKKLADLQVREIVVNVDKEAATEAELEGIPFEQLSVEKLTEKAGKPKRTTEDELDDGTKMTVTRWSKGHFTMELEVLEDGSVHGFTSDYEKK